MRAKNWSRGGERESVWTDGGGRTGLKRGEIKGVSFETIWAYKR